MITQLELAKILGACYFVLGLMLFSQELRSVIVDLYKSPWRYPVLVLIGCYLGLLLAEIS